MKFQGRFQIGERESREGKNGEYCKITIRCFGASFKMFLPENLVPDAVEGKEAMITFEMVPGKYLIPEIRIVKIEPV